MKKLSQVLASSLQLLPCNLVSSYTTKKADGYHESVEKRKISYFGLARNLIQHWISPNQDDLSYSARTFISG